MKNPKNSSRIRPHSLKITKVNRNQKKYLTQVDKMSSLKTIIILLPILLCGCINSSIFQPPDDYYYINPNKDLNEVGKVALLELANNSSFPQISISTTEALYNAVQKKQVFSLKVALQDDPAWKGLQLEVDTDYNFEELAAIREVLNCNAILTGTVTVYKPYPHMIIGLRLKLVDLTDGDLLWALEQIWDTADKTTENRIKKYCQRGRLLNSSDVREKLITVSSIIFLNFVADETAKTLSPRK